MEGEGVVALVLTLFLETAAIVIHITYPKLSRATAWPPNPHLRRIPPARRPRLAATSRLEPSARSPPRYC
jgi:hypothetical protein